MKYGLTALLSILLLLSACSKTEKKEADETAGAPVAKEAKHTDASTLHIEPTMLRDLRITTTLVEQRSGGESAAVLGELHPNENAYAEVGAPILSRIVNVNVAPVN
jgi:cobalt-zinc-cadmium efflux system membrane fusion protein